MDDEGAVPKVKHRSQPARQATFISVVAALVVSSFLFGIHLGTTYSVPLLGATKTSIKTHPVLFEEKREFWGFNDEANEAWNNFLPDNGGFLLQKSKNGSIEEVGVSMFHQLHCLRMIREGIRALMLNKSALDAQGHFPHHIQHCFDYLRQVSMLIEPPIKPLI